jgi:hypothetical protein
MHDLVLPPPVPLWPATLLWLTWRGRRAWRRAAYRREAPRPLAAAKTPAKVAAILARLEAREPHKRLRLDRPGLGVETRGGSAHPWSVPTPHASPPEFVLRPAMLQIRAVR